MCKEAEPLLYARAAKKNGELIGCHMQFSTEDLGQLPLIQDPATLKKQKSFCTQQSHSPNLRTAILLARMGTDPLLEQKGWCWFQVALRADLLQKA